MLNHGELHPLQAAWLHPKLRAMMGYSVIPPSVGQIAGTHPQRRLDPEAEGGYRWLVRDYMPLREERSRM